MNGIKRYKLIVILVIAFACMGALIVSLYQVFDFQTMYTNNEEEDRIVLKKQFRSLRPKEITIGIVDEHNDVLYWWFKAAHEGYIQDSLPLLHIDSHSDGAIPRKVSLKYKHFTKEDPVTHMKEILMETNIGDFIPVAQHMGIVNEDVMWISSNWPNQSYNFQLGIHEAYLGVNTLINETVQLCYFQEPIVPHSLTGMTVKSDHCHAKDFISKSQLTRWDVVDLEDAKSRWRYPYGHPYILDIDLDYFASDSPTLISFLWNIDEIYIILALLEKYASPAINQMCNNDRKLSQFLSEMLFFKFTSSPSENEMKTLSGIFCHDEIQSIKHRLWIFKLIILELFNKVDYFNLGMLKKEFGLFSTDCKLMNFFGLCNKDDPVNDNPPKHVIEAKMKKIGELISKLGPPQVVTIARSLEGYCPNHLWSYLEKNLISTLQHSIEGKTKVKYIPGFEKAPDQNPPRRQVSASELERYEQELLSKSKGKQLNELFEKKNNKTKLILLVNKFRTKYSLDFEDLVNYLPSFFKWKHRVMEKNPNYLPFDATMYDGEIENIFKHFTKQEEHVQNRHKNMNWEEIKKCPPLTHQVKTHCIRHLTES